MRQVAKALVLLVLLLEKIAAVVLLFIAVVTTLDVSVRWLTGQPLTGVFEISSVALVAVTMLALPSVLLRHQQLRVDILFDQANPSVKRVLTGLDCAVGVAVLGALIYGAAHETIKAFTGGYLQRGTIAIPTWLPNACIWLGAIFAGLVLLMQLVETLLTRWQGKGLLAAPGYSDGAED